MIFCVRNENDEKFDFDISDLTVIVGNEALRQGVHGRETAVPQGDFYVNLLMTDDTGIQKINADTRGIDVPTDVLSFPAFSFETPGLFLQEDIQALEVQDPETGGIWLGDVILNADRIRSQAREYGHSEKREFAFLLVHAVLHLQGYDHETEADADVMERLQKNIMETLKITRE